MLFNKTALKLDVYKVLRKSHPAYEQPAADDADHEKVLYPYGEKLLTDLGYEVTVLGVNRRLRGEWNTPDIVGYKSVRHEVLLGADLEVVTIEAKWNLSKYAVAEGTSLKRFAHRAYLLTNESIDEIDRNLVISLVEQGLGLICKSGDGFVIQIPAQRSEVPPYVLDAFLLQALSAEDRDTLRADLAKAMFADAVAAMGPK